MRSKAIDRSRPSLKLPWAAPRLKAIEIKASLWAKTDHLLIEREGYAWGKPIRSHTRRQSTMDHQPITKPSMVEAGKGKGDKGKDNDTKGSLGKTADGEGICYTFNGDKGCKSSNCAFAHVCYVVMPSGVACGGSHSRTPMTRRSTERPRRTDKC